jgi:hypothetical protein
MMSMCLRVHTLQANSIFQRNTNTLFVVAEFDRLLQGVKASSGLSQMSRPLTLGGVPDLASENCAGLSQLSHHLYTGRCRLYGCLSISHTT